MSPYILVNLRLSIILLWLLIVCMFRGALPVRYLHVICLQCPCSTSVGYRSPQSIDSDMNFLRIIISWSLVLTQSTMGVDHGGGRGRQVPPEFGVGDANANCHPQILSYRYKKERSVVFKIRHNPFSPLRWGSSRRSPRLPSRLGRGHPPQTQPHLARTYLRRWPCVPPEFQPDLRLCSQHIISVQ